jgi:hypothetical protein
VRSYNHYFIVVVRTAGVEPAQPCGRGILSPLRLPVSPRPQLIEI